MPKSNQIIKLSILILFAIIFSILVIFAIKDKISAKASLISQNRAMLISLDRRENSFINLKNSYGIVSENLPIVKSYFPIMDDVESFIDRIDNITTEFGGTKMIRFDNNPEVFGQNLRKLNFTLTFSGKRELFSKFANKLDKLPYFTKINKIDIRNSTDSSVNPDIMTINASLFLKR